MFNFLKKSNLEKVAERLYVDVVCQARQKQFYIGYGVADTSDGRFDMILLHSFLLFKRLKMDTRETKKVSQAIFDIMFADMDKNLREIGIGDIGVNHKVKGMVKAFYGRVDAYEKGIDQEGTDVLELALARNLYRKTMPKNSQIKALAHYVKMELEYLKSQSTNDLLAGKILFRPPKKIT